MKAGFSVLPSVNAETLQDAAPQLSQLQQLWFKSSAAGVPKRNRGWHSLARKLSPLSWLDRVTVIPAPRRAAALSRRAAGTGGERTAAAISLRVRVAGLLRQALCLGEDCRADGAKRGALAPLVHFQTFLTEEGCNNMPRAINHKLATPPGSPPPAPAVPAPL